jgi:Protein of unknown function (DUF3277)
MSSSYSFMDVFANLTGPTGSINLGYGAQNSDEGISFEMVEDKNTMTVGADGAVMHSLHAGRAGHIRVRLLKTSPVNALLEAMYNAQTVTAALHGQNTIVCNQRAANDVTTAQSVAFKKKPNLNYGKEGGLVEWEFDAGRVDSILGTY